MSEAYERVRGARLAFKGHELATHDRPIDKNNKKNLQDDAVLPEDPSATVVEPGSEVYTFDAAKNMEYEEIFLVETRKFGYNPNVAKSKSVEDTLDERVKKMADCYSK